MKTLNKFKLKLAWCKTFKHKSFIEPLKLLSDFSEYDLSDLNERLMVLKIPGKVSTAMNYFKAPSN